ncbi:conjugative relaxase-like TrwC/TraI family protein [Terracoccus luteus]|uniref:Conjugative relaxase-like TrwC/TraI family protein n=1 Tax=Terracoccus luteus TaxID=53356 RepID=A0A495Y2D7_9MICO|nr:MobF family relaxase [Terracoccus luteus]RKT79424.1 conjugative relaxase-like TrwC/TraI family protein [Terracoccus luteus]
MSIRRMTLGSGYRYLMASVARGDADGRTASPLTDYYTQVGTPRGRFLGRGLAGLDGGSGIAPGSVVTEEQLWRMLGMLQDPATGVPLGRSPGISRTAYVDALGRARKTPKTVAGFDLTFSAPKSVSVAWALADEPTRARIRAAHQAALEFVIGHAEERVFATRTGRGGVVSDDVRGVVAAAFEHWDSRAGDPQLHTHVVVLNRVQAVSDGGWRTLDSKAMFRAAVGLSELYNGVLSDLVTADLGYGWAPEARRHSGVEKWEVTGVGKALRAEFSQRSTEIEVAKDVLVEQFVASHGRQPTVREVLQLRQQATLATRPDKHLRPLSEMVGGWRKRAEPHVGASTEVQQAWVASLADRNDLPRLRPSDLAEEILADAARVALENVAAKRATFTRANILAEVLRQVAGVRFITPDERVATAEHVADIALTRAVRRTPNDAGLELLPDGLLRPDGTSRFRPRDSIKYTSREVIDAEQRLLDAGRSVGSPAVDEHSAAVAAAQPLPGRDHPLSAEQADAVCRVAGSGRSLDVLVGPAGTGKSTTMAGVRAVWEATFGPGSVVGLAPSAAAAEVLADAVGVQTENTAKWLTEHARLPERQARLDRLRARLDRASPSLRTRAMALEARRASDDINRWRLRPGQLVIIDEASMVGTLEVDQIATAANAAGAKVLLVGDWAQLSPVQAGGAFKLLATDRDDAPQLHDVRRFRKEWERDASLKLRTGRPAAADEYDKHGRVIGGDRDAVLDALFTAWQADVTARRTSLMIAADAQTVTDLNTRARAHRVTTGDVSEEGITVRAGTTIGEGDHIVTRLNQRDIVTGEARNGASAQVGEWVKNGDQWIVTETFTDGSIRARRPVGGRAVTLPADYVCEHVELGYATTAHRAQGRTVDTAHAYVTATTTREPLYVMATRGRESNRLYVDTMHDPDVATAHDDIEPMQPVQVLKAVLARPGSDTSATATRVAEAAAVASPSRLAAEGAAVLEARREDRYLDILRTAGVTEAEIDHAKKTDTLRPLIARMHHAERFGIDLDDVAVRDRWKRNVSASSADLLSHWNGALVGEMGRRRNIRDSWPQVEPPESMRPAGPTMKW